MEMEGMEVDGDCSPPFSKKCRTVFRPLTSEGLDFHCTESQLPASELGKLHSILLHSTRHQRPAQPGQPQVYDTATRTIVVDWLSE
eukprot:gene11200-9761_t